jgi:hypothetical protein
MADEKVSVSIEAINNMAAGLASAQQQLQQFASGGLGGATDAAAAAKSGIESFVSSAVLGLGALVGGMSLEKSKAPSVPALRGRRPNEAVNGKSNTLDKA